MKEISLLHLVPTIPRGRLSGRRTLSQEAKSYLQWRLLCDEMDFYFLFFVPCVGMMEVGGEEEERREEGTGRR